MDAEVAAPTRSLRERLRALAQGDFSDSRLRESLLPYLMVCLPYIATSVFAQPWLSWLMGPPSLLALYRVTSALDPGAFAVPPRRGLLAYALPLNALVVLWSLAMMLARRPEMLATTVLAHSCLLYLATAPAWRRAQQRRARRVPLRWSFGALAVLVVVLEGLSVFGRSAAGTRDSSQDSSQATSQATSQAASRAHP